MRCWLRAADALEAELDPDPALPAEAEPELEPVAELAEAAPEADAEGANETDSLLPTVELVPAALVFGAVPLAVEEPEAALAPLPPTVAPVTADAGPADAEREAADEPDPAAADEPEAEPDAEVEPDAVPADAAAAAEAAVAPVPRYI